MSELMNGKPIDIPPLPPDVDLEIYVPESKHAFYMRLVDYKHHCILDSITIPASEILQSRNRHAALQKKISYYKALLKDHGVY